MNKRVTSTRIDKVLCAVILILFLTACPAQTTTLQGGVESNQGYYDEDGNKINPNLQVMPPIAPQRINRGTSPTSHLSGNVQQISSTTPSPIPFFFKHDTPTTAVAPANHPLITQAGGGQDKYQVDWETWRRNGMANIIAARVQYETAHNMRFPNSQCWVNLIVYSSRHFKIMSVEAPTPQLEQATRELIILTQGQPWWAFPQGSQRSMITDRICIAAPYDYGTAVPETVTRQWKN